LFRLFQRFQRQDRGALTNGKSVAMNVERPATGRGQRLQRIKAGKDELTERIVATGQNAKRAASSHQLPRVSDRVRAGGASIGDDCDLAGETEGVGQIQRLTLSLVMDHARRLPPT